LTDDSSPKLSDSSIGGIPSFGWIVVYSVSKYIPLKPLHVCWVWLHLLDDMSSRRMCLTLKQCMGSGHGLFRVIEVYADGDDLFLLNHNIKRVLLGWYIVTYYPDLHSLFCFIFLVCRHPFPNSRFVQRDRDSQIFVYNFTLCNCCLYCVCAFCLFNLQSATFVGCFPLFFIWLFYTSSISRCFLS